MKLQNVLSKLGKLGTVKKVTTQVKLNGENDTIVMGNQHTFYISLSDGIIEFTTFEKEDNINDFVVTTSRSGKFYPSTLAKAIRLATIWK